MSSFSSIEAILEGFGLAGEHAAFLFLPVFFPVSSLMYSSSSSGLLGVDFDLGFDFGVVFLARLGVTFFLLPFPARSGDADVDSSLFRDDLLADFLLSDSLSLSLSHTQNFSCFFHLSP